MTLSVIVNEETLDKRRRGLAGEYYVDRDVRRIRCLLICIPHDKTDTESVKGFNIAYFCCYVRMWPRAVITSCIEML
jgi:hypothetical protein